MLEDFILDIQVSTGAPAIERVSFGKVLALCQNLSPDFTERVRTYTSAASAESDPDLSPSARNIVNTFFAQVPSPEAILVGNRLNANQAQVENVLVLLDLDGDYTITINGEEFTYSASGNTLSEIRDGLIDEINLGDEEVTATANGADSLDITSDTAGLGFTIQVSARLDLTSITENVSAATELAACIADTPHFYGVILESRNDTDIKEVAQYVESTPYRFVAQSNGADLITSVDTDLGSYLKLKSYRRTTLLYHSDNAELFDVADLSKTLGGDFDLQTPQADLLTLSGVAADTTLTDSAVANLKAKNVGSYWLFKGVPASFHVVTSNGNDLELEITADWYRERIEEAVAQNQLNAANNSRRIQYNDTGFQRIGASINGVLLRGEAIGHANQGSSVLEIPERSSVSSSDEATGTLRIRWGATYSGKVKEVVVRGFISVDFEGF
jgi:hypothetical protein